MLGPVACVGPGRLGPALLRRWHDSGLPILGVLGRRAAAADAAVEFCGSGRRLDSLAELRSARVVLLSVGDQDLASLVDAAAQADAVQADSLWLHSSGVHGLEVLAPLRERSARLAAMHPLCPVPNREIGHRILSGKAALIETGLPDRPCLDELAQQGGLVPVHIDKPIDRALYHATCSLAANGLTSMVDLLGEMFRSTCGLEPEQLDPMLSGLMTGSLEACSELGTTAALSGPMARGDRMVLAEHLAALAKSPGQPVYRALMLHAVGIAQRAGHVNSEQAIRLQQELEGGEAGTLHG